MENTVFTNISWLYIFIYLFIFILLLLFFFSGGGGGGGGYGGGCLIQRQYIMKMTGNISDWLSNAGGALINMADSAGLTNSFWRYCD